MTEALVQTVRGPVTVSTLGTTLMHEHIFILTPDSQANWPGEWDEEAEVAGAIRKLRTLRETGVTTIVDPTVEGLGRYIPRIERVNAEVDLNIVVATGIYTYSDIPNYFRFRPDRVMVDRFVADIRQGIQGTGVRAAFLKCAIDEHGLTVGVEKVLRAVAGAHRKTGAPVMVHTHPGSRTGLEVQRVMAEERVEPARVLLAHCGDGDDVEHLTALAEAGFVLGMDRFGLDVVRSLEDRVSMVVELCRRGFADRMVLSQDACCYLDWTDPTMLVGLPRWNYLHVLADVVPALRERGVAEEEIGSMLVDVPRRFFGGT